MRKRLGRKMKEAFHPRQCNVIDALFLNAKVPLTRHMVAMWDRFDMRLKFHINSDANRFEFILWYIWEFLPARTYKLPPLPPEITSSLAGPVRCHQDLPRFWYGI